MTSELSLLTGIDKKRKEKLSERKKYVCILAATATTQPAAQKANKIESIKQFAICFGKAV